MGTSSGKMTIKDAAAYLASKGYHCSVGTVRALVKANKIRCQRPGVTGKGPMEFTADRLDLFLRNAEIGADQPDVEESPVPAPRRPRLAAAKVARRAPAIGWRDELAKVKGS